METTSNFPVVLSFQEVEITCPIENGHRMIPVKTICTLIGLDFKTQNLWLKAHEHFHKVYKLIYAKGANGKNYKMRCLSFLDIGYWLASITTKNRDRSSIKKQQILLSYIRERNSQFYKQVDKLMDYNRPPNDFNRIKGTTEEELEKYINAL